MRYMKTVRPGKADVVHVETELGIVNIHVGLRDRRGRRVERVEVIPNAYAGEPRVRRYDDRLVELKSR